MREEIASATGGKAVLLLRRFSRCLILLAATTVLWTAILGHHGAQAQTMHQSVQATSADLGNEQGAEQRRHFALKRGAWFEEQRAYPYGHIPAGAYWHAQLQKRSLVQERSKTLRLLRPKVVAQSDPLSAVKWTPDGPAPVYSSAIYTNPPSGRATSVAVDPADPNTIYLGTAAGGVWKTTDGGQTWVPATDSQASLAIGAVAIDPNNPNTVYVGTGEPDFSGDSYYGQGLLKSTDAGASWTLIRAPFTSGDIAPSFTSIAVQPGNSNVVIAGNVSWDAWNGSGRIGAPMAVRPGSRSSFPAGLRESVP